MSDSSSTNSDSSDESDIRARDTIRRRAIVKKDSSNYAQTLTEELQTIAYKSNIIKLKLDEDLLQRLIYLFSFNELLEIIFSHYEDTCEVLLEYPKIGGENTKYFFKKAIGNILHMNIDVYIGMLITEFPGYGVICISKLHSHCGNITFSEKSRYDRIFHKATHKEESQQ